MRRRSIRHWQPSAATSWASCDGVNSPCEVAAIIARLRIFEALRIYAAAHDGQLPEKLSDIHEVPIPVNPYDDKPFTYHRDGNRAMLGSDTWGWAECPVL